MAKTVIIEDESNSVADFDDAQKAEIVNSVLGQWSVGNSAREPQLNDIEVLRKLIYQACPSKIEYGKPYVLPDLAEAQDILLSHLSENVYHSNEALFEAKGLDSESIKNAPKQKASIVFDLDNMNFKRVIEDANEEFSVSGEYIFFVGYEEKKRKRKARKSDLLPIINGQTEDAKITKLKQMFPTITKMMVGEQEIEGYLVNNTKDIVTSENIVKMTKTHVYYEVTVFEGTKVSPIKATDFIIDTQKIDRVEDANKIWRKWLTVEEIFNNKNYEVPEEDLEVFEDLKKLQQTTSSQSQIQEEYLKTMSEVNGNQVQVFDFYGDLVLEDGTELKNYIISVCRGKIIRCEQNPYFIDPFVYYAPISDPDHRRGISALRIAIIFNAIRSNISNVCTDALRLVISPPNWVVKGQIDKNNTVTQYEPGKNYEYDTSESSTPPTQMDFSKGLSLSYQVMQFFENTVESATGLTKNLGGSVENQERKATEIRYAQQSASIRLQRLTDKVKRNVNIALVEKIADFKAIFESDTITAISTNPQTGQDEPIEIDSLVRNGRYRYTYLDDKSAIELEQNFQRLSQWVQQYIPTGIVNINESFLEGLEQLGVKNPQRLVNADPINQVIEGMLESAKLPDDQKVQIKGQLRQQAAQLLQQSMQQQQPQMQPQGMM